MYCLITIPVFAESSKTTIKDDSIEAISTLYNDGKECVSTVYEDVKSLGEGIYPDIKEALSKIASALGTATEHVYSILVKNFIIEGVGYLFKFITGIILFIFMYLIFPKVMDLDDIHFRQVAKVVAAIILFTIGMSFICSVPFNHMLTCLINPEWEAIKYIMDYAKSCI